MGHLAYVDWFNHRRIHNETGKIPPGEFEAIYYPPERRMRSGAFTDN